VTFYTHPLTALLSQTGSANHYIEDVVFITGPAICEHESIAFTSHNILQQLNELVDWAQMQREESTFYNEKTSFGSTGFDESLKLLKDNSIKECLPWREVKVPLDIYVNGSLH